MENQTYSMLQNRRISLPSATDIVRFGFIVQDSISYLDLKLCQNWRVSDYNSSFCTCLECFISNRLTSFVNTEEKCRKFFSPSRRLLYRLHLDLPKGRELCFKGDLPQFDNFILSSVSPHISEIVPVCGFHTSNLSDFIEESIRINIPKLKMLKWILKISYSSVSLLSHLKIRTVNHFISCFYPEIMDSELFKDFVMQFPFADWAQTYEEPEILEYLLYFARFYGRKDLEEEDFCIDEYIFHINYERLYLNIGPILKYIDSPIFSDVYDACLFKISEIRPSLTEAVLRKAERWINEERICHMLQIIYVFLDNCQYGYSEPSLEALRLIWHSVPDAYITFGELKLVFGASFSDGELKEIYAFYVKAIGESPENLEPRSIKHLCRTVLRKTLREAGHWIPEGISQMGLPNSLQTFLNLENP